MSSGTNSGRLRLIKLVDPAPDSLPTEEAVPQEPSYNFVLRLRAGDPEAIAELYRDHHRPLRLLARRLLGDILEAEDVVHDVFVAMPELIRRYRGQATLQRFLLSVTVNFVRRRRRSLWNRRARESFLVEAQSSDAPPATSERRLLARQLSQALGRLSFIQRATVVLCLVEGRSAAEVAEILGIPEATVRTRLFNGRRRLQQLLGEEA